MPKCAEGQILTSGAPMTKKEIDYIEEREGNLSRV